MKRALHYICAAEKFKEAIVQASKLDVLAVYDDGSIIATTLQGYITSTRLDGVSADTLRRSFVCTQTGVSKPFTIHII